MPVMGLWKLIVVGILEKVGLWRVGKRNTFMNDLYKEVYFKQLALEGCGGLRGLGRRRSSLAT